MSKEVSIISAKPFRDSFADSEVRDSIKTNFKSYKENFDNLQNEWAFGRDVPYHRPNEALQAELQHVHLLTIDIYDTRNTQYNNTSDYHLAYCFNDDRTVFCLLDMLNHDDANSIDKMLCLSKIAEKFRTLY
ncbi:type II toxin-antitoxin system YafO family toxin [Photobacterium leiognathi]|uniref:type II toxin-antitoxin system YafO family toxin n=1 Tax=Photobacterium leiognathi TaxID=553611 RepID=UPI001EDD03D2|nr:type II toxin-antitoxin system YafO family toxin [Photobacterium leiognathi]MCG3884112.1 type II toxin-antitoxin system YafO family toxin [Photobacterium leiognathi]